MNDRGFPARFSVNRHVAARPVLVYRRVKQMTVQPSRAGIPADILALSHERDELRRKGKYDRADDLKRQIEEAGYGIKDNPHGAHLIILPSVEVDGAVYRTTRQVPSLLDEADSCAFSVNILACDSFEETKRCVESVARSEERRVGKECRSRWLPHHEKKYKWGRYIRSKRGERNKVRSTRS